MKKKLMTFALGISLMAATTMFSFRAEAAEPKAEAASEAAAQVVETATEAAVKAAEEVAEETEEETAAAAEEEKADTEEKGMFARFVSQVRDNLHFVLVILLVAAVIIALARVAEIYLLRDNMNKVSSTKYITICGMFGALAAVLMMFEIPLVMIAPSFYKLDFSELPVMIGGMYLGPMAAVIIELVKILLKLVLKGTTTAFVGDFANFTVGCALVLPAVIVYHTKKNRTRAAIGLIVGTLCIAVFGSAFNAFYLLPAFSKLYGMPLDVIIGMGTAINSSIKDVSSFVLICVFPLNIIKGAVISILTMLIYKHISKLLHGMMNN